VFVKPPGLGDLQIILSNIHHISKEIGKPLTVLARRTTGAAAVFKHDPFIDDVIDSEKKDFFNIINKIKSRKFDQCYIFSDSIRLYLIAKLSGIKKIYHYPFFSKKGKNFYKTAQEFTEEILKRKINSASKIYWEKESIEKAKKDYDIKADFKNIICGISASGPTKRWDIDNYIKLFQEIGSKFPCKFFLFGGKNDEILIERVMSSVSNCVSLSKLDLSQIIPIIAACRFCISNDSGPLHISANLNLNCLGIFCDSPPSAYGLWNPNIRIIVPAGETIKSTKHNTRGNESVSFKEVLQKSLDLIS
jgi:heptosyltransferase-2